MKAKFKIPELVLPGGDLHRVKSAFLYGANAVYIGLDKYSLRKAEVRFTISQIEKAIKLAHSQKKKIYVTFNIFAHDKHLKTIASDMKKIASFEPDAFIISDPGIILIAKKAAPKIPIHLSTQANTINSAAVEFWRKQGIKRVVLGREATLKEIAEIKKNVPKIEIEVFVHGAMCISYSGRCLASAYLTRRSANLGECTQPCRWKYRVARSSDNESLVSNRNSKLNHSSFIRNSKFTFVPSLDQGETQNSTLYLEESSRPGEYFELDEDSHGSYLMSSKDLCLAAYLDKLAKAGVDAFKIEGRNKTDYYVAVTARTYSCALNLLKKGEYNTKAKEETLKELSTLTHRDYTTGFLFGDARKGETFPSRQPIAGKKYLGYIRSVRGDYATVTIKNKIEKNKIYEVVEPNGNKKIKVLEIINSDDESIQEANPGRTNEEVKIKTDIALMPDTFIRDPI